jgi:cytochrome c-type biogenesis protein CcmE
MEKSKAPPGRARRRALFGVLGATAALIATICLISMNKNLVYYVSPAELLERGPSLGSTPVRLGGVVQHHSVRFDPLTLALSFRVGMLADGEPSVEVSSHGTPPQMFSEGTGTVVEGRFDGQRLVADRLMVKHSNEYRPPAPGEAPQRLFTTLTPPDDAAATP